MIFKHTLSNQCKFLYQFIVYVIQTDIQKTKKKEEKYTKNEKKKLRTKLRNISCSGFRYPIVNDQQHKRKNKYSYTLYIFF